MIARRAFRQLVTALGMAALLGSAANGQPTGKGGEGTSINALEGKTWALVQFGDGDPAPTERPITVVFGDGKISGSGGCNRYSAGVTSPSPGALKVAPVAATKMACPGPVGGNEQRYFAALSKVTHFSLEGGGLVLSPGRMVFKPKAP
ncbi:MAG TPA: META domain-containing protein [Thermoanaerobaculia bacterium]|nr:META domain-containing protein [Thermoanaerobaculia bacterium]